MASSVELSTLLNNLTATTTIMETFTKSMQAKDAQMEELIKVIQAKDTQIEALTKAVQAKENRADFNTMRDQILTHASTLWPMVKLSDLNHDYGSPPPDFRVLLIGKSSTFRAVVVHGSPLYGTKHPFIEGHRAKNAEEAMRMLLTASMSLLENFSEAFLVVDEYGEDERKRTKGGYWYGTDEA